MSLENKIEKLTAAIEKLTEALYVGEQLEPAKAEEESAKVEEEPVKAEEEPVKAEESVKAEEEPTIKYDDFRKECIKYAKALGKEPVKNIIESVGASNTAEVAPEDYAKVLELLSNA